MRFFESLYAQVAISLALWTELAGALPIKHDNKTILVAPMLKEPCTPPSGEGSYNGGGSQSTPALSKCFNQVAGTTPKLGFTYRSVAGGSGDSYSFSVRVCPTPHRVDYADCEHQWSGPIRSSDRGNDWKAEVIVTDFGFSQPQSQITVHCLNTFIGCKLEWEDVSLTPQAPPPPPPPPPPQLYLCTEDQCIESETGVELELCMSICGDGALKYSCVEDQCVLDPDGVDFHECEASCPELYTCTGGMCVPSETGVELQICEEICNAASSL
eukprot:COSAG01_NODE_2622_length_7361_cov_1.928532_3_plen_270_part_00